MDKFIKLHLSGGRTTTVNSEEIKYVIPFSSSDASINATIVFKGSSLESGLDVEETVDDIYALLTGDRKYFVDKARESRKLARKQVCVIREEDGCTPIEDLTLPTANVTSCHSSSITVDTANIITINGGNAPIQTCVTAGAVTPTNSDTKKYPYGGVMKNVIYSEKDK